MVKHFKNPEIMSDFGLTRSDPGKNPVIRAQYGAGKAEVGSSGESVVPVPPRERRDAG